MVALAGAGNEAEGWAAGGGLEELPPARRGPPGRVGVGPAPRGDEGPRPGGARPAVVAAHRGDEVLGLGGTLQALVAAGHDIEVVTLGGGREPGTSSLDQLGVGPIPVVDLGGADDDPDGVVALLAKRLVGASWCLTP